MKRQTTTGYIDLGPGRVREGPRADTIARKRRAGLAFNGTTDLTPRPARAAHRRRPRPCPTCGTSTTDLTCYTCLGGTP